MATYRIPYGNSRTITHRFTSGGTPLDLANVSVWWRLRTELEDANADAVLTHAWLEGVESGLSLTDPATLVSAVSADGILYNYLSAAELTALDVNRRYAYTLDMTDENGEPVTLQSGSLRIIYGVPRFPTLKTLRREIGRSVHDCDVLMATGGTDTTFIDTRRLTSPTNAYKGRTIYLTGGTPENIAESRYVISSDPSARSVQWSSALPEAVVLGDEAELWGRHGAGFVPWEVNDVIRAVQMDACYNFRVPISLDIDAAFDADSRGLAIPDVFTTGIYAVRYQPDSDTDNWIEIDPAGGSGMGGWWVERGLRTLTIGGDALLSAMDGTTVRIHGYGTEDQLEDDEDETEVNKEYLVAESIRRLIESSMHGQVRPGDVDRNTYATAERRSIAARDRVSPRPHPNWQRV